MKSIKERAEEYSFIGEGINPSGFHYRDFNINKQEGFKAGANYVLECIELYCNEHVVCNNNIKHLIEQLKK